METVSGKNKLTAGRIVFTFIYILIFPAIMLFISGNWYWIKGWIFTVWFLILCYGTIIYLYINNPELLLERYKKTGTGGQKGWDLAAVYGIVVGFISWITIMPLDAERFSRSPSFHTGLTLLGLVFLILSSYFLFSALKDNTFASHMVRVQKDRKQKTVTTGVYGFVRHPMYLGGALLFTGGPLFFGSVYGLIIGFLMTLLLMVRIIGEEKVLADELEGYQEYRKKVKYRLLPFIW
jgi:protein-S-isoprenylcysteine O-methyltransferase Ste14